MLVDLAAFAGSYTAAFLLRFDGDIPRGYISVFLASLPWVVAVRTVSFWQAGAFRAVWRYVSAVDIMALSRAVVMSTGMIIGGIYLSGRFPSFPRSVFFIDAVLVMLSTSAARLGRRVIAAGLLPMPSWIPWTSRADGLRERMLIVGGGDAGEALLREIERSRPGRYRPVAIADDDTAKQGKSIHNVPVAGRIADIPRLATEHRVDRIVVALPSATSEEMQRIVRYCRESEKLFWTMPGFGENDLNGAALSSLREVRLEDLFGRPSVALDLRDVEQAIAGTDVLVTGAGGSIGSELCQHLVKFKPARLVLFEKGENALFYLHRALSEAVGRPPAFLPVEPDGPPPSPPAIIPVLGDITNADHVDRIIAQFRPQLVFHAAAHKHVPLTEINPCETVRNNLGGTRNVVDACGAHRVGTFVLLSTDKAANPINVMGMTKHMAERYVSAAARHYGGRFLSVRFGNVLDSTGSVLRIFREQLEQRKPLTVTHPDAMRYFMSKSEAMQLVLKATTLGRGGEIFVLAMGQPVKIADMAREFILLAGLTPGKEVAVTFIGARPGEKLAEELVGEAERAVPTPHPKILAVQTELPDWSAMNEEIDALERLAAAFDAAGLRARLDSFYPTGPFRVETSAISP